MAATTPSERYLAVIKASYDYAPQSSDEVAVKEDQILLLVERTDEDWWKVKVKGDSQDAIGLVPAAYVEQAEHTSLVKALYDYDAAAPGELSVKEDAILRVFESEGDWILAQAHDADGAGYVPANYVEEASEEQLAQAAPQIVIPDSPPRPVSTYVDPADRVASHKITADDIKTWSVSEIDKKGKKKKGTLGIGSGSLFFASESDKAAVQKWQTSDVTEVSSEKAKHIQIEIGGPTPISLHFHAGSKDTADEIIAKTKSSKALSTTPASPSGTSSRRLPPAMASAPKDTRKVSVHFNSSPVIIPAAPREEESEEEEDTHERGRPVAQVEEYATTLYDFTADGDDELSAVEGERLLVLERDGDDWWKCRNTKGKMGMVPASYLEFQSSDNPPDTRAAANRALLEKQAAEEEERRLAQEAQEEQDRAEKQAQEERRQREEQERLRKMEAQEKARIAAAAAEAQRKEREERKNAQRRPSPPKSSSSDGNKSGGGTPSGNSKKSEELTRPPSEKTRVWHDRSGQFRVEAAFLGFSNGKLRLHKVNGVIVEVPAEKMSMEDMRQVEKLMAKKQRGANGVVSDDEVPLAIKAGIASRVPPPPKKAHAIDWFDFFLSAGCDVDDCTKYASAFERDKMDETLLSDITDSTMRSLGLREGDIIRVKKAIEKRKPTDNLDKPSPYIQDQIRRDEELARQLQAQEGRGTAPNLFAGPRGALKNNPRRGRPQPKQSLPLSNVDIKALSSASDAIQSPSSPPVGTPSTARPSSTPAVDPPPRSSSALAPAVSGFDDDAWTNRPSSTKPLVGTPPPVTSQPQTLPPAPAPPQAPTPTPTTQAPPSQPTPAVQPVAPTVAPTQTVTTAPTTPSLAQTTESDIFTQLERLKELRTPVTPQQVVQQPVVNISPPIMQSATFPRSAGMGMSYSPVPMGQLTQGPSLTPSFPPFLTPSPSLNGPRGPYAPVPGNQSLLQPLIPTQTGFNSFVPTRPPTFQAQPPPLPQMNMQMQQPNTLSPLGLSPMPHQQTGLPMNNMNNGLMMQTGLPMNGGGLQPQATGMPMNNGFGQPQMSGFGQQLHPTFTGFNPSMTSGTFNTFSNVPPMPPIPSQQVKDTSPANVFASMKSGTFENETAPRPADIYDPFRSNPSLQAQPTGWGGQGFAQGGMGYHH